METMMAGAAILEVFLASLAVGGLLTAAALRGAFWLMQSAGIGRSSKRGNGQIARIGGAALALAPIPLASARRGR